jgi:hypothetical protein
MRVHDKVEIPSKTHMPLGSDIFRSNNLEILPMDSFCLIMKKLFEEEIGMK